jgi:pilus assembly protein CpaC
MPPFAQLARGPAVALALLLGATAGIAQTTPPVTTAPVTTSKTTAPQASPPQAPLHQAMSFETGTGRVVTLSAPAANVFVADPKIAEVRPASATALFIFGVGPGRTTVAALDNTGKTIADFDVAVRPSGFSSVEAEGAIARIMPGSRFRVSPNGKGMVVTGTASSPREAARVLAIVRGYSGEGQAVEDQIAVQANIQVALRVRIAEMDRNVTRNLGINWQALGTIGSIGFMPALTLNANAAANILCGVGGLFTQASGTCKGASFNGVIDALAQDNLAHILAEPNLTVMSGQTGSFLAGGEIPIPMGSAASNAITVDWKTYGVMLHFLPTVLDDGRINLKVSPEVSQLDYSHAITVVAGISSITIPALTVRRAETMVELGSGQSFAIAGLLQHTSTQNDNGLPGLGDVPVLGAMFRSDQYARGETELVIVVTPYIVRPVNDPTALHLAGETFVPPNDLERVLGLRQIGVTPPSPAAGSARIPGNAGFIVQ